MFRITNALIVGAMLAAAGSPAAAQHEVHAQPPQPAAAPAHAAHGAVPEPKADPHAHHSMPSDHENHAMPSTAPDVDHVPPKLPAPSADELGAAFPELGGMDLRRHMRTPLLAYLLVDQLEWQDADEGSRAAWEVGGWLGYDFNRLWLRSEGERVNGEFEAAEAQLLYGRAVARWWDVVLGLRQDFEPGPGRSFAAVGVQGLAPYWFETQFTVYAGERGQLGARLELEYEFLLTNRLILQPLVELNAWSRSDRRRGIGSGLSDLEAGLRLRFEIRREFAPYVGVNYERVLGNTADLTRAGSGDSDELTAVAGLRLWF